MKSEGILLINKEKGKSSFNIISSLRRLTNVKKIGHSGTLDPLATGLMVILIGKNYTKKSNHFLNHDKEYLAEITLGQISDTFDGEGEITSFSSKIPTIEELSKALSNFQGHIQQIPPMFSAKKINGQKLYMLARKGICIDRKPISVTLNTELVDYLYPLVNLKINCSKGTYIRSLANDLGKILGCGGFLSSLCRTRVGPYSLKDSLDQKLLYEKDFNIFPFLKKI